MIFILHTNLVSKANYNTLIQNHLPKFSKEFQEKIHRYQRCEDKYLSLLGRLLLEKGMEMLGEKVSTVKLNKYGKPILKDSCLKFNISHSGLLVVCAISKNSDVGIDIEKIKPINIENFKSQMSLDEWISVSGAKDIQQHFYRYWTQKEAAVKADGRGLSVSLRSFEVTGNSTNINNQRFFLYEIPLHEHYCCSLALMKEINYSDIKIIKVETSHFVNF